MRFWLTMQFICIFLWVGSLGAQNSTEGVNTKELVRFGVVRTIMGEVNKNDVKAALGFWMEGVAKEMNIAVEVNVRLYSELSAIKSDLEAEEVDMVYITTPMFPALGHLIDGDGLLTVSQSGTITEEYILLVHQDSPANEIHDLRGKSLNVLDNARTAMGMNWLNVFLSEKGLGKPGAHFKNYKMVNKINDAILPVFFKQADTCLVSRKGFEIMAELNPQIARQMKIVATSEYYIPTIMGFRTTYQSFVKRIFLRDFQEFVESTSGSQLLTIFQNDGLHRISTADLEDSIRLVKKNHSLRE